MTDFSNTGTQRLAMLIDADNAEASLFGEIIAETSKYGNVTIRRIYGDWTTASMNSWKGILNDHAIVPIQQFRYTVGKNATDSAMIIDAMDILYGGTVNGFCLVSSDSDFTRLATRIREKGLFVMGIGRKTTPKPFVTACEIFVFTENLQTQAVKPRVTQGARKRPTKETDPLPLLTKAVEMGLMEDGWAFLAVVGNRLRQLDPSFDARTYGHGQLTQLIKSFPDVFELREEKGPGGTSSVYVRLL